MSAHQAEAVILRKWPVREADEIVSLFTRTHGRIRGVAKAAAKSRRRFGGALEPMTWVSASYVENPKQDLVRLDACEVIASPLSDPVSYPRAAALAFYAEVLEEALPDHDPHEAVFRLVLAVLDQTRGSNVWMPVTYFALWITRLLGWMPSLTHCTVCGDPFGARRRMVRGAVRWPRLPASQTSRQPHSFRGLAAAGPSHLSVSHRRSRRRAMAREPRCRPPPLCNPGPRTPHRAQAPFRRCPAKTCRLNLALARVLQCITPSFENHGGNGDSTYSRGREGQAAGNKSAGCHGHVFVRRRPHSACAGRRRESPAVRGEGSQPCDTCRNRCR